MLYILDSNAFSDLMREHPNIVKRLEAMSANDRVAICSIVRGEIVYGITRLPDSKKRRSLEETAAELFNTFRCEPIPASAAIHYANIKLQRERSGMTLDENDLWIAATVIALNGRLVIRDSDFSGIDGLSVEDWTRQ